MAKTPPSTPEGDPSRRPILNLRGAVIILLAFVTGCCAGALTFAAHHQLAEAVLAGLTAVGASVWWFDRFIA